MANNYPVHIKIDVSIESDYLYKAIRIAEILAKNAFGSSARILVFYDEKQKSFEEVSSNE